MMTKRGRKVYLKYVNVNDVELNFIYKFNEQCVAVVQVHLPLLKIDILNILKLG